MTLIALCAVGGFALGYWLAYLDDLAKYGTTVTLLYAFGDW